MWTLEAATGAATSPLVGGPGWASIPINMSNGDGSFNTHNEPVWWEFPFFAESGTPVAGDFNGDGRADIALTGVPGWSSIPVAFSWGDGTFLTTNVVTSSPFYARTTESGAKLVSGDFNGDGKGDIAVAGTSANFVPVAFSLGTGAFTEDIGVSFPIPPTWQWGFGFPAWARQGGVKAVGAPR